MRGRVTGVLALSFVLNACASAPYAPSTVDDDSGFPLRPGEPQIERGRPNAFLDGLGHYVLSLPSKLLLLSWRVENHAVSETTEEALVRYLQANGLCNVKVRINQYAVAREWSRLFRNRTVAPFWRYTLGILSVATYTALPQRVFGGDNYNPYTHTIHIYSDLPAVALHEAGHAKDFVRRTLKGTYAALRILPLAPLYQEGVATGDALGFSRARGDAYGERRDTPLLWGAWGSYLAGEGLRFYDESGLVRLATFPVAWLGHGIGVLYASLGGVPPREAADPEEVLELRSLGRRECRDSELPQANPGGGLESRADDPRLTPDRVEINACSGPSCGTGS